MTLPMAGCRRRWPGWPDAWGVRTGAARCAAGPCTFLVAAGAGLALWQLLLWRRRRQWQQHFDAAIAQAGCPLQRVQQASELLRRAALAQQPDAASLAGEAWQCW